MFGTTSIDQMRKNRQVKKTKSLVEKIVNNAKKKEQAGDMLGGHNKPRPTGLKYGMDTSSDLEAPGDTPVKTGKNASSAGAMGRNGNKKHGSEDEEDTSTPTSSATPTGAAKAAPAGEYYPPASDPRNAKAAKPRSSNDTTSQVPSSQELFGDTQGGLRVQPVQMGPKGNRVKKDAPYENGVSISFKGVKAFANDANGNQVPLKDGYYTLPGSTQQIRIQNGEKIMDY